jgi:hypothetical protein
MGTLLLSFPGDTIKEFQQMLLRPEYHGYVGSDFVYQVNQSVGSTAQFRRCGSRRS